MKKTDGRRSIFSGMKKRSPGVARLQCRRQFSNRPSGLSPLKRQGLIKSSHGRLVLTKKGQKARRQ